jgi:NTE family protein
VTDLERYGGQVEIVNVPPLCPLAVSPYDFSRAGELIERAAAQTRQWLERGGLAKHRIPGVLRAEGTLRPVPGARRRREFSH